MIDSASTDSWRLQEDASHKQLSEISRYDLQICARIQLQKYAPEADSSGQSAARSACPHDRARLVVWETRNLAYRPARTAPRFYQSKAARTHRHVRNDATITDADEGQRPRSRWSRRGAPACGSANAW